MIALVVLHHAMLAYCRFGHLDRRHYLLSSAPVVDPDRWVGFDLLVLLNDSFFMPLMFLLSGLFVWHSLTRKRPLRYLRDRLLRLGVPFVITVSTVVPLAYYPSYRLAGGMDTFGTYWIDTVSVGPWPSGPAWFIGVLLLFDIMAALIFGCVHRWLPASPSWVMPGPATSFGLLVASSAAVYIPPLIWFGPSHWFSIGPFAVQASRIGLYALYFGVGVIFGAIAFQRVQSGLAEFMRHWSGLLLLAVVTGGVLILTQMARLRMGVALPAQVWLTLYGLTLIVFCAAMCPALISVFLRFGGQRNDAFDGLAANAYGIYLLHYAFVTWIQYGLLDTPIGALAKASLVFVTALLLSWWTVSLLRRVPGVAHVI